MESCPVGALVDIAPGNNFAPGYVHLFIQADPSTAPSQIAATLKSISAVHIFTAFPQLKGRKFWGSGLWSPSTYYGSVGHVSEQTVRRYIQDQKKRR